MIDGGLQALDTVSSSIGFHFMASARAASLTSSSPKFPPVRLGNPRSRIAPALAGSFDVSSGMRASAAARPGHQNPSRLGVAARAGIDRNAAAARAIAPITLRETRRLYVG